ncbi:serine/arginine repetitive matrix protein 1-like isoform X2 [Pararge aegeria]|nr:serine/arginine repetitive matrix protein 1-like isoform X2 [Pararge aegeria]
MPIHLNTWIYIGIGVAVLLIVSQTLCFFLYIRKLKSYQSRRSITNMAPLITPNGNSDRYQRAPSRINAHVAKPAEQNHTCSLYEYECVKDITDRAGKKPEPPPTSTLPKRNRPPLPLPNGVHGPKSSTLTAHSTQQLLQLRGREVSTVPSKSPVHFNPHAPLPSRSPQTRRLPTPLRTSVLKPQDSSRNDRSHKIYESLPDLRGIRHLPKPPAVQPPIMFTPPTPSLTPDLNRARRFYGRETPSPVMIPKPRLPLPQEYNRNGYPPKRNESLLGKRASRIYESLPDVREFQHHRKPTIASPPPVNFTHAMPSVSCSLNTPRRVPDPEKESITNELMEKLKRRANLNSQSSNAPSPALPRRTPVVTPPRRTPKPQYIDESSEDEEWTIEEIKQINMYNV